MKDIEDIYELSPMQEGMLFHTIYAPDSGVYIEQYIYNLSGYIDVSSLKRAWQEIVNRHPIFRSSFHWGKAKKELQVVHKKAELPWDQLDWRNIKTDEQEDHLESYLRKERKDGFELKRAPLMRCSLIQVDEERYRFIWMFHHILLDGWSMPLIMKEVLAYYEAFRNGEKIHLPLPRSFRDYIIWLQQQDISHAEEFWRKRLEGFTEPVPLMPARRVGIHLEGSETYKTETLRLPADFTKTVQSFARREQITQNTIFQGIWAILLSLYNNTDDILFGENVSGRPPELTGAESMIGLFINALPVRIQVKQKESVLDWLRDVQIQQTETNQYAYASLINIQKWSEVKKGVPLFEIIVAFENYPVIKETLGNKSSLIVEDVRLYEQINYPVSAAIVPGDELSMRITYDAFLFENKEIQQFIRHFELLLKKIVENPHQKISEMSLLNEEEENEITVQWNNTFSEYATDNCAHQLFELQCEQHPDSLAVVYGDQSITYGELNVRATKLACYLRSIGVRPGVFIGIYVERSLEMVVGMLAVFKSGGVYVPMDPASPVERIAFILNDINATVLLTMQKFFDLLPEMKLHMIDMEREDDLYSDKREYWSTLAQENPVNSITCDYPAYVIYTSGSTGHPKGVLISHKSLLNFIYWFQKTFNVNTGCRTSQLAGLAFDAVIMELWPNLCAGACIVLIDPNIVLSPLDLQSHILQENIALSFVPTPLAEELLRLEWPLDATLKTMITGGDKLHHYPSKRIPFKLVNMYGPTENTVVTTATVIAYDGGKGDPHIGRPVDNVCIYILDKNLQPVPVGIPGELYTGGDSLAIGYVNRPDLTAEKFIPNPFADRPGERLYKTGDLVRYLPDGRIEFLGRIDNQIKIRGFRIEAGEIETTAMNYQGVNQCAVIAKQDKYGNHYLVAYLVGEVKTSDLCDYLKIKLPEYMVPAVFVFLDSMPVNPNGKIDRKNLPEPDNSLLSSEKLISNPITPTEEILTAIWSEVLGVKGIGRKHNFFELGGHSLLATQVVSRVRRVFSVDVPVLSLFELPVLSDLSREIEKLQRNVKIKIPPISPKDEHEKTALSFAQERLWFLDKLYPQNHFYNILLGLNIKGQFDVQILEKSFNEIIRRHESLRASIETINGEPVLVIARDLHISVDITDLQHSSDDEQKEYVKQIIYDEYIKNFDISRGPLIRCCVLKLKSDEHILLFAMHHIISDGWSMGIFLSELTKLYGAFSKGEISVLPELSIQYPDFAVWQRENLDLQPQLDYWGKQLTDLPLLELPLDFSRPAVQSFRGGVVRSGFSSVVTDLLKDLAVKSGCSLFMVMLGGFVALLSRYTNQKDIVLGSPIANRNYKEIEPLIGFFVNTLVLRCDLSGNPNFLDLLIRIRKTCFDAYANQDVPFEKLVSELQPQRDMSRNPLAQVTISFQNMPIESEEIIPGLSVNSLEFDPGTVKCDIELHMAVDDDELKYDFLYSLDLFGPSTIKRMSRHYKKLMESMVNNPEMKLNELSIFDEDEMELFLSKSRDINSNRKNDICIHHMFESCVEKNPGTTAMVFEDQKISYLELNIRSNQLAHYLISEGVIAETLVGICMKRSVEMIVAILGILKAGGAYMPIDTEYPKERIRYMLDDSDCKILLTEESYANNSSKSVVLSKLLNLPDFSKENPALVITPRNLAYVIYTSGSTGHPKGCQIEHGNMFNYITWGRDFYIKDKDFGNFALFSSLSFDFTVTSIFCSIVFGRSLHIYENDISIDKILQDSFNINTSVDIIKLTPSHILLLKELNIKETNIRKVIVGGEELTWEHVKILKTINKDIEIINEYGPTEATVGCIKKVINTKDGKIYIGKPISNTTAYIFDSSLNISPVGVKGELYIGGLGVGRGYHNRAALTAEKFIPDPFSGQKGDCLYRTGDLARLLPDGNIEFLGRKDDQVKIRGFRVELGEIESAIKECSGIDKVVVVMREDVPDNKEIVAYLVTDEKLLHENDLHNHLKEKLPDYMIPSSFVVIDKIPLTQNGKLDKHALPVPEKNGAKQDFFPPRDIQELELKYIWEKVMNIYPISVRDNFFELGGHSILAVRLLSRIEEQLKCSFPLASIFEAQTIEAMATLVRGKKERREWSPLIKIQPSGSKPPLFCVHPAGGGAVCYADMGRRFAPDQPVYGLQPRGLEDNLQEPHVTVEDMAACYVTTIQEAGFREPFQLAGASFGGLVAFEMARQFESAGKEVSFVGLLDTYASQVEQDDDDAGLLWALFEEDIDLSLDYLRTLEPEELLNYVIKQAKDAHLLPPDFGAERFRLILQMTKISVRASMHYNPGHYKGKVVLFRAKGSTNENQDNTLGWKDILSENFEVKFVPGSHQNMFREPHVGVLVESLKEYMMGERKDTGQVFS
ncbi:MAG: amino acid adenylation domain-containing protein [Candidatus Marinimicrobia bacterium]|jgi:amino acid adenylation domain-containing protein|nr:amino acid adenylation domain-containing protein [Candidatus Neomarinimicrobiota bacterium]